MLILIALVTLGFTAGLPRIQTDTDPEYMLRADAPICVYNDQVKGWFDLQDVLVLGVVNDKDPNGVLNAETLGKIYRITQEILKIDGVVRRNVWSFPTTNHILVKGATLVQERLLKSDGPHDDDPQYRVIPDSRRAVAQFLLLYLSSGNPSDLQDFVTHYGVRGAIGLQGVLAGDKPGE